MIKPAIGAFAQQVQRPLLLRRKKYRYLLVKLPLLKIILKKTVKFFQ